MVKVLAQRAVRACTVAVMTAALAVFAAVHLVPTALGWVPLAVYTGSMEPVYRPGDAVVVDVITGRDEADLLGTGDIITFMPYPGNSTLVTHRITSVGASMDGERVFYTQGDANSAPDDFEHPITHEQVRGKAVYSIPLYGYVLTAISWELKQNLRMAVLAGLGVYILWQAGALIREVVQDRKARGTSTSGPVAVMPAAS